MTRAFSPLPVSPSESNYYRPVLSHFVQTEAESFHKCQVLSLSCLFLPHCPTPNPIQCLVPTSLPADPAKNKGANFNISSLCKVNWKSKSHFSNVILNSPLHQFPFGSHLHRREKSVLGDGREAGKYGHNEEKEEERSEGIKKKLQIHTDFDCKYTSVQWKIVPHSILSQRQLCFQYCYLIFQRQNCILNLGRLGFHVFIFFCRQITIWLS